MQNFYLSLALCTSWNTNYFLCESVCVDTYILCVWLDYGGVGETAPLAVEGDGKGYVGRCDGENSTERERYT